MMAQWFIALGDVQVGPLPVTDLETRWRSRELSEDTLVWRPGMTDWRPLAEVEDLVYLVVRVPQVGVMVSAIAAPARLESLADLASWEVGRAESRAQPTDDVLKLADLAAMGLPAITPVAKWGAALPVPQEQRPSISWTWRIVAKPPRRVRPAFLIAAAVVTALAALAQLGRTTRSPAATVAKAAANFTPPAASVAPAPVSSPPATLPRPRVRARGSRPAPPLLTRELIVAGVRRQASALLPCIKAARSQGELTSGRHTFVLSFHVAADGSVSYARLEAPSYALATSLPACLARVWRGWEFPASASGTPVKNFPLPVTVP